MLRAKFAKESVRARVLGSLTAVAAKHAAFSFWLSVWESVCLHQTPDLEIDGQTEQRLFLRTSLDPHTPNSASKLSSSFSTACWHSDSSLAPIGNRNPGCWMIFPDAATDLGDQVVTIPIAASTLHNSIHAPTPCWLRCLYPENS